METDKQPQSTDQHKAGVLDIRNVIGSLLAIYGVILLAMGVFGDTAPEKTGNINANLYAGIVLLVVGLGFIAWVRIRPISVPETVSHEAGSPTAED